MLSGFLGGGHENLGEMGNAYLRV
uniref:Uncharacterized protein n=1 Tax=Arundo donax TaxID=35708 RepID=A0A0A9HFS2_ARUDO